MASRGETFWDNAVNGRRGDNADTKVALILPDQPDGGGSRPIKIQAENESLYWLKLQSNPQGERILVNEQVVARLGELIGAAVCDVALIEIPESMHGTPLSDGRTLTHCIVHGSKNVPGASFSRSCNHLQRDNNGHRIVTLCALFDWCCGGDEQWLYATEEDYTAYSHDHGHYFGCNWTTDTLNRLEQQSFRLKAGVEGFCANSMREVAERIRGVTSIQIADVLARIPASWTVGDTELNALGRLIDIRRMRVADRLVEAAGTL